MSFAILTCGSVCFYPPGKSAIWSNRSGYKFPTRTFKKMRVGTLLKVLEVITDEPRDLYRLAAITGNYPGWETLIPLVHARLLSPLEALAMA